MFSGSPRYRAESGERGRRTPRLQWPDPYHRPGVEPSLLRASATFSVSGAITTGDAGGQRRSVNHVEGDADLFQNGGHDWEELIGPDMTRTQAVGRRHSAFGFGPGSKPLQLTEDSCWALIGTQDWPGTDPTLTPVFEWDESMVDFYFSRLMGESEEARDIAIPNETSNLAVAPPKKKKKNRVAPGKRIQSALSVDAPGFE
ncbi:hypothetical protein B0H14DRAFT_2592029 [Mycena olivaceomarginata]|nr:hypothetical protein B0H14DRAFT_2592029 [Mycena olivaceomarginata]